MAFNRNNVQRAMLFTTTCQVVCPMCGDAQPNRTDGSDLWEERDFDALGLTPSPKCVSCDHRLVIATDSHVQWAFQDKKKAAKCAAK